MTTPAAGPRVVKLTHAERRVIGLLADDGPTDQQIADRLELSTETVKSHLRSVMRHTGYHTRCSLVCALLRRRIVIKTVTQRRRDDP